MKPTVVLTFDVDWAPEEVLEDTVRLLDDANVPATFFATHPSAIAAGLVASNHEVGIHPNFNPLLNGAVGRPIDIIRELKEWFPSARGSRSHSLVQGTPIFDDLVEAGIEFDCSLLAPYDPRVRPHRLSNGLLRIPYFWEDDVHFEYDRPFLLSDITLDDEFPNVFDFHPIHVFLNTESRERYRAAKASYQDPRRLREMRNANLPGTRDLLQSLLTEINAGSLRSDGLTVAAPLK